jgi:hypothetical protein
MFVGEWFVRFFSRLSGIAYEFTVSQFVASNYGAILGMFMMPAIATGMDKIPLTVSG